MLKTKTKNKLYTLEQLEDSLALLDPDLAMMVIFSGLSQESQSIMRALTISNFVMYVRDVEQNRRPITSEEKISLELVYKNLLEYYAIPEGSAN